VGEVSADRQPRQSALRQFGGGADVSHQKQDWTFKVEGITTPSVLRSANPETGWYLKSVTLGGRDITDVVRLN